MIGEGAARRKARDEVARLVEKFEAERNWAMSEADVRVGYIDVLFQALGWNIRNDPGQATNYYREGYVRGAGFVDVGLEIRRQPVLFLEAKRFRLIAPSTERTGDRSTEEKQAFRYARGKKITYAILTNFERLHLFNADHERLIYAFDSPQQYLDDFEALWRLSPGEVEGGSLPWWDGQLQKKDVDLEFLSALRLWRLGLAKAIYELNGDNPVLQDNGGFDFQRLMEAVQRILDRLILIRFGDDKEVLLTHDLLDNMLAGYRNRGAYARPDHLMAAFVDLSHMMDEHHNTSLFAAGHVCEKVILPNEALAQVIDEMNRISFRKFTSDILGNTYESYLGTKLVQRNGQIADEERRDIRKGRGIYYTPRWVVEYIVDNTLGRRLKELEDKFGLEAIDKVRGLAVLDPACGSGSFLIYAYHVLADFYRRLNQAIVDEQTKLVTDLAAPDMFDRLERLKHLPQPVIDYPQVILKEHLFGVDLDPEAAEIAAVNLTMQAFADSRQKKLPLILNENIKVGNSLISGGEAELRPYFGDGWQEKRPLNWEQEFPSVMGKGGFDVVIGNPPYIPIEVMEENERRYFQECHPQLEGKYDSSVVFILALLKTLRPSGRLGFISSVTWQTGENYGKLRQLLFTEAGVEVLIDLPFDVFKDAYVDTGIYILSRMPAGEYVIYRFPKKAQPSDLRNLQYTHVPRESVTAPGYKIVLEPTVQAILARISAAPQYAELGSFTISTQGLAGNRFSPVGVAGGEDLYPFVVKGQVYRYALRIDALAYADLSVHPSLKPFYDERPKLLVRRVVNRQDRLMATYEKKRLLFKKDVNPFAVTDSEWNALFVLGLLNSSLISYLYVNTSTIATKDDFRQTTLAELRRLPIRRIDFNSPDDKQMHDRLVALVERMLESHKRLAAKGEVHDEERAGLEHAIALTDAEIDNLVYDLYELTEEERKLVEGGS
ncbi:MAG: N-6 DNA methylase [Chloroflexi bacterium]|nr:N-6 DNA methylase [Chloroflexota bacterium]